MQNVLKLSAFFYTLAFLVTILMHTLISISTAYIMPDVFCIAIFYVGLLRYSTFGNLLCCVVFGVLAELISNAPYFSLSSKYIVIMLIANYIRGYKNISGFFIISMIAFASTLVLTENFTNIIISFLMYGDVPSQISAISLKKCISNMFLYLFVELALTMRYTR